MSPMLSVIIPVYNSEAFLPHAIKSVLETSINEIEIVIVNDASLGNCAEIVQHFLYEDSRIKYVRHPYNKGLLAARFTGVLYATGEYIVHLDADDRMIGDSYAKAYNHAIHVSAEVVYFNTLQCDDSGKQWHDSYNTLFAFDSLQGIHVFEKILASHGRFWVWHVSWNKIIKREVMLRVIDRFTTNPHVVMCEDLLWSIVLCIELLNCPKISAIEDIGILYFRHEKSITKRVDHEAKFQRVEDLFFVFNFLESLLKQQRLWKSYHDDFCKLRLALFKIHCFKIDLTMFLRYLPRVIKLYWLQYRCFHTLKIPCQKDLEIIVEILVRQVMREQFNTIVIFGTGELAQELYQALKVQKIEMRYFISTDTHVIGTRLQGIPILTVEEVIKKGEKNIVIASIGSKDLIKDTLEAYASDLNIIYYRDESL